jgi:uncharacterized protein YaiE (UPF0345 family)
MIKVNECLEGKVKSLGFELDGTQYTVGVMLPGEYSFDTEREEHITVAIGGFEIRPPGADWKKAKPGESVVIPGNSTFDLKVNKPASYICMYR